MALTEEDKRWMLERFATKEDLERFATKEELERVETRLLTGFHKWASPFESRLRTFKEALHTLDLEFDQVKDRVTVLEGRKSA
jgi:hypothetical protein